MNKSDYSACHYGERANDYVSSKVHSEGPDLAAIERQVVARKFGRVLDIGCGGGHVSYCVAPHVGEVVACDVTQQMLTSVSQEAKNRGLSNVSTVQSPAEKLPFADGEFDAVFCRFTTHHWSDAVAGLREAKRVLAPSGLAIFIDVTAPVSPLYDSWLQTLELLRDVCHCRDFSVAEWATLLAGAGFALREASTHRLPLEFQSWIARTKTPEERVAAIRSLQKCAPSDVTAYFSIQSDGSFEIDVTTFIVEPVV
ncbi:LAME_0G06018g1_1 [Lachancea meyersii CBS 8951]|uniref:LAME_0G06018g1_1 n=1 Tax=Lachancea meyersii CBS 8951 TaxID=1266667 RepID=A0A1G4K7H3_9SACH|nr:LAME_0G06018g1_1 [Lachancea meyersii CBS 8951]